MLRHSTSYIPSPLDITIHPVGPKVHRYIELSLYRILDPSCNDRCECCTSIISIKKLSIVYKDIQNDKNKFDLQTSGDGKAIVSNQNYVIPKTIGVQDIEVYIQNGL
ncbi:hypothetical protein BDC45DRAFT_541748 [Circinella umbellata]|nr:hypothetical protein BDC45DRAFT_541748 [Circinella umbellata]